MINQLIILRKDLKMTKGKMVSQSSHASLGVFLKILNKGKILYEDGVDKLGDISKQTIILRKDLQLSKGEFISHGSFLSLATFLKNAKIETKELPPIPNNHYRLSIYVKKDDILDSWFTTGLSRSCLFVKNEKELIDLMKLAKEKNIPTSLITDIGKTMFHGEKTKTALAIGPCEEDNMIEFVNLCSYFDTNNKIISYYSPINIPEKDYFLYIDIENNSYIDYWLKGIFTKITLGINSNEELKNLLEILKNDNVLSRYNKNTPTSVSGG